MFLGTVSKHLSIALGSNSLPRRKDNRAEEHKIEILKGRVHAFNENDPLKSINAIVEAQRGIRYNRSRIEQLRREAQQSQNSQATGSHESVVGRKRGPRRARH